MSKRLLCFALLALMISINSGCQCICCLHDNLLNLYKSRRWQGCGCGDTYYNPWYNDPPDCSDPCDDHGFFNGRRWWKTACDPSGSGCRNCGGGQGMGPMTGDSYDAMDGGQMLPENVQPSEEIPTPAAPRQSRPRTFGPPSNMPPSTPPRVGRRAPSRLPAEADPNWDIDQEQWSGDAPATRASYRR
jgi:hypothetical protein